MRAATLTIALVSCTRTDETSVLAEPPAPPSIRPVDPGPTDDELVAVATQLDHVTSGGCRLHVKPPGDLAPAYSIPLGAVTWKGGVNWEKRPTAIATCTTAGCIDGRFQSRTTDIPHVYSTDHRDVSEAIVFLVHGVADPAKVIAELQRVSRLCAKRP